MFGLKLPPWPADKGRPLVVGAGAGGAVLRAGAGGGRGPSWWNAGNPWRPLARMWSVWKRAGEMDPESNVVLWRGAARARFSDGKLTCGLNSPHIRTVLGTLVRCGAPEKPGGPAAPHRDR